MSWQVNEVGITMVAVVAACISFAAVVANAVRAEAVARLLAASHWGLVNALCVCRVSVPYGDMS